MNICFLLILIFLISRFFALSEGRPFSAKRFGYKSLIDLSLINLCFLWSQNLVALISGVLLMNLSIFLIEQRLQRSSSSTRFLTMLVGFILISCLCLSKTFLEPRFNLFMHVDPELLAFACAVLLCLKESNFIIRAFFQHYRLVEKVEAEDDAPKTDNGRIIGNLERLLLLLFLWEGAALAATFIVAVKGLARFKKMEEHQAFAEYVIIGTFLSVLITLVIFKAIKLIVR